MKRLSVVLPLLFLALASDRSPLERLPRDKAGDIARRAITYAGGWDAWAAKKTVEFRKTTRRLRPDGSVERTRVEIHRFRLQPSFGARIEWEEEGQKVVLINSGTFTSKVSGGSEDFSPEAAKEARDATFESHYVFGMPFKLTDPGAHLASVGPRPREEGTSNEGVRVTYDRGAGDAGGRHTWTDWFEPKSGRLAATHVNYEPGKYQFTELLEDRTFGGIRLATRRRQFNADASGKRGPLVSESIYEDVRFDVPLDESLFALPPR